MKTLRLASLSLAVAALLPSITSCKSDPSPFNWTFTNQNNDATIQLNLNVAETRAGGLTMSEENIINTLSVLVFDANDKLELKKDFSITELEGTDENKTLTLEVSHGLKTLYVVTAKKIVDPAQGMSLVDYEKSVFNSSLSDIIQEKTVTGDGDVETKSVEYVMVGKSDKQQVMVSASPDNLPASNNFNISLIRLVAKAQVKAATSMDVTDFGITLGDVSFKAFQLNERMRVMHNGTDVFDASASSFVDENNDGTYDNYTRGVGDYLPAVSSDFTAEGCAYMSENIVSQPLSGNTTFLGIRFATTPTKYYTFDQSDSSVKESDETPVASTTYYAVGVEDAKNGMVDYALYSGSNNIVTFKDIEDAQNYVASLNNGEASAITVSQIDSPMMAPADNDGSDSALEFKVITFDKGYAYYRVNIAHNETSENPAVKEIKVVRNKFYKISINSVNSLGFGSDELLMPKNPEAVLDAEKHAWIKATISVAPWDEVEQDVDL